MVLLLILGTLFVSVTANILGLSESQPTPLFVNPNQYIPQVQNNGVSQSKAECPNVPSGSIPCSRINTIDEVKLINLYELVRDRLKASKGSITDGEVNNIFYNIVNAISKLQYRNLDLINANDGQNKITITIQYEIPTSFSWQDPVVGLTELINKISANYPGLANIISEKPKDILGTIGNFINLPQYGNILGLLPNYRPVVPPNYGPKEEVNTAQNFPYSLNLVQNSSPQLQKIYDAQNSNQFLVNPQSPHKDIYQVPYNNQNNTTKTYDQGSFGNNAEALVWKNPNVPTQVNVPYNGAQYLYNYAQPPYISSPNILTPGSQVNSRAQIPKQTQQYNYIGNGKYLADPKLPYNTLGVKDLNLVINPLKLSEIANKPVQYGSSIYKVNQPNQNPNILNQNVPNPFGFQRNNNNIQNPMIITSSSNILPVINDQNPYKISTELNKNQPAYVVNLPNLNTAPIPKQIQQYKNGEVIHLDASKLPSNIVDVMNSVKVAPYAVNNPIQYGSPTYNFRQPYQNPNNLNQNVPNPFGPNNKNIQNPMFITSPSTNLLDLKQTLHDNHVVEITYVLQRPKPVQYEPVYLVKYRLPLKVYEENLYKILSEKPYLRHDPNQLYKELLSTTNLQTLNDEPGKENQEVINMISNNGTFVGTKFLRRNGPAIDTDLNVIKTLNSNLSLDDVLKINNGTAELERLENDAFNAKNQTTGRVNNNEMGNVQRAKPADGQSIGQPPLKINNIYKAPLQTPNLPLNINFAGQMPNPPQYIQKPNIM